jgi:hypothetical protein
MSFEYVYKWREKVLPRFRQREIHRGWIAERIRTILPEVMKREKIDMWIVAAKECNEDPVIESLTGSELARRQTVLIFTLKPDESLEAINISRYSIGVPGIYRDAWNPESGEDQWACVGRVVREHDPKVIGINTSKVFAFGDGLSYTQYQQLAEAVGPEYAKRFTSAERVAVGWLERRIPAEMDAYPGMSEITHGIIAEGFSSRVIHPGITTAGEALKWFNTQLAEFGCGYVKIQRQGVEAPSTGSDQDFGELSDAVIRPGDLLRCDCGMRYCGLHTDVQQNAYVLKPGEYDAPAGLKAALATANRLQDILAGEFVAGRTGNEILARARAKAIREGIKPCIYAHPIGFHDHGAGPSIGLWDQQDGVPGRGDFPLHDSTCYAMELNVRCSVPEWDGQEITVGLEEEIGFFDGQVRFFGGRQTAFHLIR